jgi:hypothetical protein
MAKKKRNPPINPVPLMIELRRARHELAAYDPPGKADVPQFEAVGDELTQLTKLRWNRPADVRRLQVLLSLRLVRRYEGRYTPDPTADIRGLRQCLIETCVWLSRRDSKIREAQADLTVSDRPVGLPAALLLGLRAATENAPIGMRRELAARERGVAVETMRRWDARFLIEQVAIVVCRREADSARTRALARPGRSRGG